jgi:hypothetical protein
MYAASVITQTQVFPEISIILSDNVNIIQNQAGDYYITSSKSVTQCNTHKINLSVNLGFCVLLLQHAKITAVVPLPGEICDSTCPTLHLGVRGHKLSLSVPNVIATQCMSIVISQDQ